MTGLIALLVVGGGIILLLMALFVTIMARSMDGARTAASTVADLQQAAEAVSGRGALKMLFGAAAAAKIAEARQESEARVSGDKIKRKVAGRTIGAIFGSIMTIGIGAGIASDFLDDHKVDIESLASMEFAAGELHGTMLMPKENAPVVLIVPGSGPTDRDGDSPLGIKAAPYKLLAWGLAKNGIGTVRIDKRGMFGSVGAGDPNAVTVEAYADDIHEWIDAIRAQTGRDCVWLLGHSEGAMMVSAAAQGRDDVCGVILVAGAGRKLGDVLREQLKANPANAPLLDQAFAAIAELEAGRHPDTSAMNPALLPLFRPEVQDFLISEMAVDPVGILARSRAPKLIVQGDNDLQVSVEDAKLLNKAPKTQLKIIKGMNHVLKDAPEDRAGNLATYENPDLALPRKLVRAIANFVKGDDD